MHIPVLLNKVIEILDPKPGEFIIDGTIDGCGYAKTILERLNSRGKFLGLDLDEEMVKRATRLLNGYAQRGVRIFLENGSFSEIVQILEKKQLGKANGLVLDLGLSSEQIEESGRGFSFKKDEPLLMTYSTEQTPLKVLLKILTEAELANIIRKYSQEKFAARIAKAIKDYEIRKSIQTSGELAKIIGGAVPKNYERGRIHPATRTFQALRIYANGELENLEALLKNIPAMLKVGGRIVIVSFHSLEDRLVKNYFRNFAKVGILKILTRKPITASSEELKLNPRSRSAKLRAAVVLKS